MGTPERPADRVELSRGSRPTPAREGDESFRALVEEAPLLICRFLPDGEITYANPGYCDYFAKTFEELIGSSFLSLVPEADREAVLANITALTVESPTQSHEHQVIAPGGEVRWQRWRNRAVFDAQGQALVYYSFGEDTTAKNQTEKELLQANRALRIFTECTRSLVGATTESELLHSVCRILVDEGGYRLAWVGLAERDEARTVRPAAHEGYDEAYLAGLDISWADTERGRGPTGTAIRTGRAVTAKHILTNPDFAPWRAAALEHGYASSTALPLMDGGRAFGALNVYSSAADAFDEQEVTRLRELADDVAHGVIALRTRKVVEEDLLLFDHIIEQTRQPVVLGGLDGGLVRFNKAFENLTGYTTGELEALRWEDLTPSRWHEVEEEHFQRLLSSGQSVRFEKEYRRKDGSTVPVELLAEVYESATSERLVYGFVTDITERKAAEAELHRYEQIVANTSDMLALLDRDYVYLATNRAYLKAFGKASAEVIGRTASEVLGSEFFSTVIQPRSERCLAGEEVHYQDWYEFPIGGRKYMDAELSPYLGPDGDVLGFVVSARDITQRLTESEELERLSIAIDQVADSIVITDSEGTIQYVNPAYERNTLYTREEAIGQNARLLESGQHDDEFYRHMWATLWSGVPWSGRFINQRKDGSLYTEEAVISPVRDASGQTVNYVSVARDITEELEREREAALLEAQYHQAQKLESLGRLVGGVAHDLNNLLSPILGYAEMLRDDLGAGDHRRESVEEVLNAGLRAKDLVRRLLAFSRKQAFEYRPLDLNQTVAGFEKLLRRTIREDVEIEIVPSPEMSSVMADVGQIEQVIMNLVVNAQDAMPDGGRLTLETALVGLDEEYTSRNPGVEPGDYVMLAVGDTGCGMDDTTREHLFEPFFSTKGELGTGLGLATVHGIVRQHGGSVWVDSKLDRGSIFKIYLPASAEAVVEESSHAEAVGEAGGSGTILLAEDNAPVRHLARGILERQGYTVLEAENGAAALKLLESHEDAVQLLLTDLVMPGMNGVALFAQAKAKRPDLKVLYMSGYTDGAVNREVLEEGASLIQKPFAIQALATKVREVLGQG